MLLHWLAHVLGLDNGSGHFYLWWSGFGSDLGEFGIIAVAWHHLNCHQQGCWRLGRHVAVEDGVHVRRCRRCHLAQQGKEVTDA